MPAISVVCTNPSCLQPLSFEQALGGTIQQCPKCTQRIIVPEIADPPAQAAIVPMSAPSPAPIHVAVPIASPTPPPAPYFREQERHTEFHKARKLNVGAGCFAMISVLFAMGILEFGLFFVINAMLPKYNFGLIFGLLSMLAGVLALGAFVFFGYIATETAATSRDSERR